MKANFGAKRRKNSRLTTINRQPEQRLMAFLNHNRLVYRFYQAGRKFYRYPRTSKIQSPHI